MHNKKCFCFSYTSANTVHVYVYVYVHHKYKCEYHETLEAVAEVFASGTERGRGNDVFGRVH